MTPQSYQEFTAERMFSNNGVRRYWSTLKQDIPRLRERIKAIMQHRNNRTNYELIFRGMNQSTWSDQDADQVIAHFDQLLKEASPQAQS